MASTSMTALRFEASDVQRLALRGHGDYGSARFELFRIREPALARVFCGRLAERVTHLETSGSTDTRLQVAFSSGGLARLGLRQEDRETFPLELQQGMASRAHALGDDERDVERWEYGNRDRPVHVLLLLYARTEDTLSKLAAEATQEAERFGLEHTFSQDTLRYEDKDRIFEHFGFRDGLVQPTISGDEAVPGRGEDGTPGADPSNPVPLGEVVLGQANGYGYRTIGPNVPAEMDRGGHLLEFLSEGRKDLGAHGSYLVFRKLEQDVAGYWNAMERSAKALGVGEEWLAARMVGRWKNGSSVVAHPDEPGPAPDRDTPGLSFAADRHGHRCPIGAHIRRTNPRDSLGEDTEASLKLVARHRLHRRGRVYGPRCADLKKDDGQKRGLVFITVGSSIRRQFEFVQNLWMTNTCFNGLHGEDDPVVGPRAPQFFGDCSGKHGQQLSPFTLPGVPVRTVVPDLPRFVTTRGGDYFFLPSRRALRFLSTL